MCIQYNITVFGTVGIVLDGLEIFLCITNYTCYQHEIIKTAIGGLFIFIQMHFIFCNSKVILLDI